MKFRVTGSCIIYYSDSNAQIEIDEIVEADSSHEALEKVQADCEKKHSATFQVARCKCDLHAVEDVEKPA